MYRFRCPSCKGEIGLRRLFDGRYLFSCRDCGIAHISKHRIDSEDEAYLHFLDAFDTNRVAKGVDLERVLEKERLLRPWHEIQSMIREAGLKSDQIPSPVIHFLRSRSDFIVDYKVARPQEPEYGAAPEEVFGEAISLSLREAGISRLYKFQEEAALSILAEKNVIIVAPTGSGKTEAFSAPIIKNICQHISTAGTFRISSGQVRTVVIYPTKALARDQLPKLRKIASACGIRVEVFDGDTRESQRAKIIEDPPDIILTNFDILHVHLMKRTGFSRLLRKLEFIVVDEVHVYTGTFGANVGLIIKRLSRIAGHFQIIAASATIANPKEFVESLFGRNFHLVHTNQARRGLVHFVMIFPSLRSSRSLVLDLVKTLTSSGARTLVFSSSHLNAELTAFYGKRNDVDIRVHRAGLPQSVRQNIEDDFKKGRLKAISSTPTLELGIDIGLVDSVISDLVTATRLTQRMGRAGRKRQESEVFLALRDNDPISQYYMNHPHDYFEDLEYGYVDSSNPSIAERQLVAAALDKPIRDSEFPEFSEALSRLTSRGIFLHKKDTLVPNYSEAKKFLAGFDIRGAGEQVIITHDRKRIGERNMPQALEELHPEAIYFLGGNRYKSKNFIFRGSAGWAEVELLPLSYPYYTKALVDERPAVTKVANTKTVRGIQVAFCDLEIKKSVTGYVNKRIGSNDFKGEQVALMSPVGYSFRTKGIVFKAPKPRETLSKTEKAQLDHVESGSYHAAEHVVIEGTNIITGGAGRDMGGLSLGSSGLIFIYDGAVGGNGATRLLYDRLEAAFERSFRILEECRCMSVDGCPRCTYSYRCGNNNDYLNRGGAIEVYRRILAGERSPLPESLGKISQEQASFA